MHRRILTHKLRQSSQSSPGERGRNLDTQRSPREGVAELERQADGERQRPPGHWGGEEASLQRGPSLQPKSRRNWIPTCLSSFSPAHPPTNHSKLPSSHCPALTSTACSGSAFHLQCPPQATLTKTLKAQTSLFHKATRSVLPSWLFTHSLLYSFLGLFIYVFLYFVGYILPYCPCSSFLGNFLTSLTCLFFWWIWGSLFCKNLRGCQHNLRVWIMVTLGP